MMVNKVVRIDLLNSVPLYVKEALFLLKKEGNCEPYIVGGAIRDLLMGKEPHDYDIASPLEPEDVLRILHKNHIPVVDKLGNNFGTVVGVFQNHTIEITTFRYDEYDERDPHRPKNVVFSKTIEEDLLRRDFTINALAMDVNGVIIDVCNGIHDIENRILQTVGNPEDRYREDPLRMYRACRFVAQFGFTYIENGNISERFVSKDFVRFGKVDNLPLNRVKTEIEKLITAPYPAKGLELFMSSCLINSSCIVKKNKKAKKITPFQCLSHLRNLSQNPKYHKYDAWHHTIEAVQESPTRDLATQYALLFHDAGKGTEGVRVIKPDGTQGDYGHEDVSVKYAFHSLYDMGYKSDFISEVVWLIKNHMRFRFVMTADDRSIRHWIRTNVNNFRNTKQMVHTFDKLANVFVADLKASNHTDEDLVTIESRMVFTLQTILTQFPIHSSDLQIKGNDVMFLISGTSLLAKDVFQFLLNRVQDGHIKNREEDLIQAVKNKVERRLKEESSQ